MKCDVLVNRHVRNGGIARSNAESRELTDDGNCCKERARTLRIDTSGKQTEINYRMGGITSRKSGYLVLSGPRVSACFAK